MKTTAAQDRVIADVKAGRITTLRTGTRDGNIVERLNKSGLLRCERSYFERGGVQPWGFRYIRGCWTFVNVEVVS